MKAVFNMRGTGKLLISPILATLFMSLYSSLAHAHCPLCTAAVGGGIVITRFYGLDDMVVGLWVGAFIVSTALWFAKTLKKEYIPLQKALITLSVFVLTTISFYYAGLLGDLRYRIFGIDKLLLGMVIGSIITYIMPAVSGKIKSLKGQALFPFQTIVMTLASLMLASLIIWLVIG